MAIHVSIEANFKIPNAPKNVVWGARAKRNAVKGCADIHAGSRRGGKLSVGKSLAVATSGAGDGPDTKSSEQPTPAAPAGPKSNAFFASLFKK